MKNKEFDIIEVVLKEDLGICLQEEKKVCLNSIDERIKKEILNLLNSSAFLDDLNSIINHIIQKSSHLPLEEQKDIERKCRERIQKIDHSDLSQESIVVRVGK